MPLLSVLDQSPVRSGGTPADAIHESLELAELADRLGYHRYWLAEHHSTPGLGGIAGGTSRASGGPSGEAPPPRSRDRWPTSSASSARASPKGIGMAR